MTTRKEAVVSDTNNSGPLYRKGTYSPKAEHLKLSPSASSPNDGRVVNLLKEDGGIILNPI